MNQVKEIILTAISKGRYDNSKVPVNISRRIVGEIKTGDWPPNVENVRAAQSSSELMILELAANGDITPEKLFKIYPNVEQLRRHLVETINAFSTPEGDVFARSLNDLLVVGMDGIDGWNDEKR